jgi:hypothetical protein
MPERAPRVRHVSALREAGLVVLFSVALAAATNWPLLPDLNRSVPGSLGDPLVLAWAVQWGGHAILEQPLDLFQANLFWPLENSLAFTDGSLLGYSPVGALGSGTGAALVHYNALFLLAYALALVGAYALARELGARPPAAALAGVAFAYAPWRHAHDIHLNVLSSGGVPLALFLLFRGYRRDDWRLLLGGWLVAAWQLSLGFNTGLPLTYLLFALVAVAAVARARRRVPPLGRATAAAGVAGAAVFVVVGSLLAMPYAEVAERYPESIRTTFEVATFSPRPESYFAAPAESAFWGPVTRPLRERVKLPTEQTLFPGLMLIVLAALGLALADGRRATRLALAAGTAVALVLSLGFHTAGSLDYVYPYRLLYEFAPGWQALRTPGRLMTFATLGLALLAAIGSDRARDWIAQRRPGSRLPMVAAFLLVAAVVAEGWPRHRYLAVPEPPPAGGLAEPQAHLPADGRDADVLYGYWSTNGFPKLVNGASGFEPRSRIALRRSLVAFPDRDTVARLRTLGVRTVVLHVDLARRTPWARAHTRSVRGLGLSRRRVGELVVYYLRD